MQIRLKNLWALASAALLFSHVAHADMWTYTDAQGIKHFASSQLDKRYGLLFRGAPAPSAEAESGNNSPSTDARVDYGVVSAKSVAAMETSPGFVAVKQHMRTAADANQLDVALLQAVIHTESRFNPMAVSPKGAVGLMQVMPATAERYGLASDQRGTISAKLTDPKTNIQTGARYLRDLVNMFPGQLELAVAAYNAGEGAVQKAGNKIPNYKETQNYVRSVMQLYHRLSPQARVSPTATSDARVHGQFHGANANINLGWGELNVQQGSDALAKSTRRSPLQPRDVLASSGPYNMALQSLTELSN
ncbi:MAG: lytic transglycosylase domain-containing protein [Rhodoferax sp.]|jgi:hypothetical protein